jgi:hypothetical protein
MDCRLCDKPIRNYDPAFHHLRIDGDHAVDLCPECIDTFIEWQGKIISGLFPTKALKKRYGRA